MPDDHPAGALPAHHITRTGPTTHRVLVITASVGAGHDGPAREITEGLRRAGHEARTVDLVDLTPLRLGRLLRRVFRWQLTLAPRRWGRRFDATNRGASTPRILRAMSGGVGRRLAATVHEGQADLIVSTFPLGGVVVAAGRPYGIRAPLVTYVTDPAAHALWTHPTTSRYLVTATAAADDLRRHGPATVDVVRPAIRAGFRPATSTGEKRRLRKLLGLPAGTLVLLTSGSWGVGDVARSARELRDIGVTPVVLCGRNERLQRQLAGDAGVIALGWSDRMPEMMRACDAVVLNSGGLTFMEALASGVPVLHYRPLPGQGHANAVAGERDGWAQWPRDRSQLAVAVSRATARGRRRPDLRAGAPLTASILSVLRPEPLRAVGDPNLAALHAVG